MSQKVVVVGAGVSGLSCALSLLEGEGDHDVEVVAERIGVESLSRVAAALFYPYFANHPHLDRWLRDSLEWFTSLVGQEGTGVHWFAGAELHTTPTRDAAWGSLIRDYRHRALSAADGLPTRFVDAHEFRTPIIETPLYLPYLLERVRGAGGRITRRTIASVDEVTAEDVVVVNATGVCARRLVPDERLVPSLGQVVRVRPFGLDRVLIDEEDVERPTYLVPRSGDCVIGSIDRPWPVDEVGFEAPPADPDDTRDILVRAATVDARVADAEVVGVECGLRPRRDEVRVEVDVERLAQGRRVVHDYGHGGSGVTLSWGCAVEVRELVHSLSTGG